MTIKIFLGNLSSETTSDKIRPLFEKYGQVVECDVLKNFGFVHMVNKNEANKAIAQLDGYSVDGNNIRVELSTGKKGGGGGGGKFDKKGFGGGGGRSRPYGPPPGRGDPRDYDRYPYPPLPPVPYDRYDPYYRYYMEREAYLARMPPLPGERGYPAAGRDRYPPIPPRERLADRYPPPDPRDRLMPPRSYLDERARGLSDPYFRERDPLAARPPPEYYDRKPPLSAARGAESVGAAGAAGGRGVGAPGAYGNGVGGDYFRSLDRPGAGLGGAAGGAGGGGDYFRQGGGAGQQNSYGRPGMGLGGKDSQSSFAQDAIYF